MSRNRTIYIHCGLHKTGSTSLQSALAASYSRLLSAGVLYPRTGRFFNNALDGFYKGELKYDSHINHHNVAFHLLRNWRYEPVQGGLGELVQEIAEFDGDVILSSEVLEWAIRRPDVEPLLADICRRLDRSLVIVIYLRNQIEYCESLFSQLQKHNYAGEFSPFVQNILNDGRYIFTDRSHEFDYARVLRSFSKFPVIVRNYHAMVGKSVVSDFASVLGLDGVVLEDAANAFSNQRASLESSLYGFYFNRVSRPLTPTEIGRIRALAARVARPAMDGVHRQAMIDRFCAGNEALCKQFNLDGDGLIEFNLNDSPRPGLEEIFSFEMQGFISTGAFRDAWGQTFQPAWWSEDFQNMLPDIRIREQIFYPVRKFYRDLRSNTVNSLTKI